LLDVNLTVQEIKNFLRINGEEDTALLEVLIDSAIEDVSNYLNNPFIDLEGNLLTIPNKIKFVCMRIVAKRYENRIENVSIEEELNELFQYRRNPGL